ncbi:MAG: pseudaminic acid cytidylyltransferase [Chitinophagaceae bacterium]|nr:pseudaminic acid cytidylyltransferase [Chitinophagaceae bacterium]
MGTSLAIIPARGGSKRIPRKNIKIFIDKPIIAYSIEAAIKSKLFDEVMVSTEDEEIARISKSYGAKIPFLRTGKNADDMAGTEDVLLEVLNEYKMLSREFETVCCIYPTAPLLAIDKLTKGRDILLRENYDTVFPVVKYAHPVQRALKVDGKKMKAVWPEYADFRTQDLETYYYDAGQYYWLNAKKFEISKQLFSSNSGFIELSSMEIQDIDTFNDWNLAELKFKKMHSLES